MRVFRGLAVLLPVSLVLVGVACSSSGSSASPTAAATTTSAPAPATGTTNVPVTVQEWSVNAPTTIPAGPVTFAVTNTGTTTHEFVVFQTDTLSADIPITSFEGEQDRINEDKGGKNLGESGDLNASASVTVTVDLPPGHYVFFCNLPGHYHQGMHLDVTVQ